MLSPEQIREGSFLLFDKPKFWTSHDVVYKVRYVLSRYCRQKKLKVGHAGTLDPLATGLLIVATGKYTKRISEVQTADKEYTGSFFLGATTASYDGETPAENHKPIDHLTKEKIITAVQQFTGEIDQVPPIHSAIKKDGEAVYHKARAGEAVELQARKVQIHSFEITEIALPFVSFKIQCGKGTYIRSLARDLGDVLGCGAYLNSLTRTAIGNYRLEDAEEVEDFLDTYRKAER